MMMRGIWEDSRHQTGTPNCFVLVNYGRGNCLIELSGFPVGVYVPVTVEFYYHGETYIAKTGFTPQ